MVFLYFLLYAVFKEQNERSFLLRKEKDSSLKIKQNKDFPKQVSDKNSQLVTISLARIVFVSERITFRSTP